MPACGHLPIRTACGPAFAIAAKVNCMDFDGGTTLEDFLALGRALDEAGIDAIEVSANGTSVAGVRAGKGEAYFLEAAELLKGEVSCPVVCVGGFRSPEVVEGALDHVDYVSMSRPLVREPALVARWHSGDLAPGACISCNACYRTPGHQCRFV